MALPTGDSTNIVSAIGTTKTEDDSPKQEDELIAAIKTL